MKYAKLAGVNSELAFKLLARNTVHVKFVYTGILKKTMRTRISFHICFFFVN